VNITKEEYSRLKKELFDTKKELKYTTEAAEVLHHFVNHYNEYRALADTFSETTAIPKQSIKRSAKS
jgi:hypothetical protein